MTNLADVLLRSVVGVLLDRIHSDEDVSAGVVLFDEPVQKHGARDCLCGEDALQGLLASAVPHENGDAVFRRMERQDVFRRRKHPRKEWRRIRHELSRGAR